MKYPKIRKGNVVDNFYGIDVEDPYRWLEDDNAEETAQWIIDQNEVTNNYLKRLPYRDKIKKRLTDLWDYQKMEAPFNVSGRWFVFKNNGLQNQHVLYLFDDLESEPYVVLDPNTLSDDGTVAFSGMDVSPDGKYLVYKISRSGSDWNEIFIKDIASNQLLDDHVGWVKFSTIACFSDGFFYSSYDKPLDGQELSSLNAGQKIYFHTIGTIQDEDKLIFSNPENPKRMYTATLDSERQNLIIIEAESTSGNGLFIMPLINSNDKIIEIACGFDYEYTPIDVVSNSLLVCTNSGAPKYKVVAIDLHQPEIENWKEIIPEKENTLQVVSYCGNKLFAEYMADAKSKMEVYTPSGTYLCDVELPEICSVSKFNGTPLGIDVFYSYNTFSAPGSVIKYNTESGASKEYFSPELKFNPNKIQIEQEFYTSFDGVKVPIFIVYKKGLELNGKNPTLLSGYGGFNISLMPVFSPNLILFIENGGVYTVPNIRGGGEYGEEWHKAGTLMQKQNVFNDFIAAAEFLISSGYTNPDKLAIRGGSNGGLLVGAVTNQRPDLFKVALPAVGVMDMLRYQKFTIGYAWATDYGTTDYSKEMFEYLLGYSPLHKLGSKAYPAILATTADHDDRVVPAHTFKYISRLQELNTGNLPTLVRIDVKAGHGSGKPTEKVIEEYTDIFVFLFKHLRIEMK